MGEVELQARGLAVRLVCIGAFRPGCAVDVRFSFRSHFCHRCFALCVLSLRRVCVVMYDASMKERFSR